MFVLFRGRVEVPPTLKVRSDEQSDNDLVANYI